MFDITLIFTKHQEIGKCNSLELLRIIQKYNPDVIFEEISQKVFNQCYGIENRYTLETTAVKMYLQKQGVVHIPVVGSELSGDVDKKVGVLIKNAEYRYLIDILLKLEEKYGFSFLNSSQCDKIFEDLKLIEEWILRQSKDEQLKMLIELSDRNIDEYENEIIKNIYTYCAQNDFDKALLFMGAAHRKALMRKVQEHNKWVDSKVNWSFYNEK